VRDPDDAARGPRLRKSGLLQVVEDMRRSFAVEAELAANRPHVETSAPVAVGEVIETPQ
jgi:hypothetical protein